MIDQTVFRILSSRKTAGSLGTKDAATDMGPELMLAYLQNVPKKDGGAAIAAMGKQFMLQSKLASAKRSASNADLEKEQLTNEVAELNGRIGDMEAELFGLREDLSGLSGERDRLAAEKAELEGELAEARWVVFVGNYFAMDNFEMLRYAKRRTGSPKMRNWF